MKTYLIIWNPKRWPWDDIEESIEEVNLTGKYSWGWSCGKTKSIMPGDRVFLIKLGTEPKGLIGSGYATTAVYVDEHWSEEGKDANYIDVDFEVLLNPDIEPILTLDVLMSGKLSQQHWLAQSSGISIRSELVEELESVWFNFLTTHGIRTNPFLQSAIESQRTYMEGASIPIKITKYERNPYARQKCLEHYGYLCTVCNFNFEKTYGIIAKDFIHVHHLHQIADVGRIYQINPINDLRPVCPNCHAVIHLSSPPYTIEEMRSLLNQE